jgi:hypothetical protein
MLAVEVLLRGVQLQKKVHRDTSLLSWFRK